MKKHSQSYSTMSSTASSEFRRNNGRIDKKKRKKLKQEEITIIFVLEAAIFNRLRRTADTGRADNTHGGYRLRLRYPIGLTIIPAPN
jgi:hypothetical protein